MEFLQEKGKNRFAAPKEIVKYLKQLARNSYRLDKVMAGSSQSFFNCHSEHHSTHGKPSQAFSKEIERMMKGIPQTLTSVKGIGRVRCGLNRRDR